MYVSKLIITVLLILFIATSCIKHDTSLNRVNMILSSIENRFAPDKRTVIFNHQVLQDGSMISIIGETNHPDIVIALEDSIKAIDGQVHIDLKLLPEASLGDEVFGIIKVSVANLRGSPAHSAELVTQTLLGMPVKIFKEKNGWYLVQSNDLYLGWLNAGAFSLVTGESLEEYLAADKIIVTEVTSRAYSQPNREAAPVSDLVAGSLLQLIDKSGNFYQVMYPDERLGFIEVSTSESYRKWIAGKPGSQDMIVAEAQKLMGLPYLWGGTSTKGVDCSGFTKSVYLMNGFLLPRDASQQEKVGILVDDQGDFSKLEAGDLLFFGSKASESQPEKVVHVGLWLGDMTYIHSSGDVHVSSMDPNSLLYDGYNYQRYLRTKRILNVAPDEFLLDEFLNFHP